MVDIRAQEVDGRRGTSVRAACPVPLLRPARGPATSPRRSYAAWGSREPATGEPSGLTRWLGFDWRDIPTVLSRVPSPAILVGVISQRGRSYGGTPSPKSKSNVRRRRGDVNRQGNDTARTTAASDQPDARRRLCLRAWSSR